MHETKLGILQDFAQDSKEEETKKKEGEEDTEQKTTMKEEAEIISILRVGNRMTTEVPETKRSREEIRNFL